MKLDYSLKSKDKLTGIAKNCGINTWNALTLFIKNLPYGRNTNRTDFGLVLSEKKGSCSSKHALLKTMADLNGIPNIKLILGIYKMNQTNTPKIGNVLSKNSIDFIPEAHCYLNIDGKRFDYTTAKSDFKNIEKDIIVEIEINPEQVVEFKVVYHKTFLKNWIVENNIDHSFSELWQIREDCIKQLTK